MDSQLAWTMSQTNPLAIETLQGLGGSGKAHLAYLGYLLIQAGVLFLWWPKSAIVWRLEAETGPTTLLAVLIAVSASVAYYSIRAGAEEILLPGQHSLWEWVLASPLKLGRILHGYIYGHILQTLHAIMLSSPLILLGYAVAGNVWSGLLWSLVAMVFQATFYRLLGALMTMTIGQFEQLMFIALRAVLIGGYLFAGVQFPQTSYWELSSQLLSGDSGGLAGFLLIHAVLSLLLAGLLYFLLARQRDHQ